MNELQPWHRQPGESRQAHHAFCHWRDLPPRERRFSQAYLQHQAACLNKIDVAGKEPGEIPLRLREPSRRWKVWKRTWNWDARADAHDAEQAEADRLKRARDIADMNERQAAIACAMQGKIIARLNTIDPQTLSPGQLIIWLEKATLIERRARGEATSIVEHQDGRRLDYSNLSEEELSELERLLEKAEHRPLDENALSASEARQQKVH